MRAILSVVALWATLCMVAGHPASGESGSPLNPIERSDDDLLVLEVKLGRLTLHDGLIAYLHPGGMLLPLGEIAAALEFPIAVEPGAGIAHGWFLAEHRLFSLDLGRHEVLVEGALGPFDSERVELHADDIYVDSALLARWFPVVFEVDLSRLQITVHADEELPVEQRLERQAKWSRLQRGGFEGERYPRMELPYRLLDWPVLENRLNLSWRADERGREDLTARLDALAAGDLLGMSAELSLGLDAGSRSSPANVRLKMGRRDPDGGLLGRLRATEVSFGDLYTPDRPLVAHQRSGRGFEISSFPLGRPSEFDRTHLRGDALPGWEVELYHNEGLIDFRVVGADGRYEFTGIPLFFGFNVLRLVFYGPQGQQREKVERLFIGPELIRSGESYYRVAVLQGGGTGRETASPGEPVAGNATTTAANTLANVDDGVGTEIATGGERRYFVELERGLRRNLSIAAHIDSLPLDDGRHTYAGVRLRGSRKGFFGGVDLVTDSRGGWAGRLATQGRIFGVDLQLEHEQLSDFVSERNRSATGLPSSRSTLRVDGRVLHDGRPTLNYRLAAVREARQEGDVRVRISGRLGASFRSVSLSNTLNLDLTRGLHQGDPDRLNGSLLITHRRRRPRLRGTLQYALRPHRRWTAVALIADWNLNRDFSARVQARHSLAEDLSSTYSAGVSRRFQAIAVGVTAGYDDRGSLRVSLSLSYGLSREPRTGRWRAHSRLSPTQGAAAARIFLDHDANGRFDDGDEPLAGVKLSGGVGGRSRTDERGIAWLTGLATDRQSEIDLVLGSLEDPYWIPQREGVGVVARPGRVVAVDFPVMSSGEIDGTVRLRRGGELQEVSKVKLQLTDPTGNVVHEATSAFDGFYLFERVLPGRYNLRVDPEQVERLHLEPLPEQVVTLASGEVVSGVDLVLKALDDSRLAIHRSYQITGCLPMETVTTSGSDGTLVQAMNA